MGLLEPFSGGNESSRVNIAAAALGLSQSWSNITATPMPAMAPAVATPGAWRASGTDPKTTLPIDSGGAAQQLARPVTRSGTLMMGEDAQANMAARIASANASAGAPVQSKAVGGAARKGRSVGMLIGVAVVFVALGVGLAALIAGR